MDWNNHKFGISKKSCKKKCTKTKVKDSSGRIHIVGYCGAEIREGSDYCYSNYPRVMDPAGREWLVDENTVVIE